MPLLFVDRLGFSISEWLQIWAVFFFVTIFTNIFWGITGEYIGWIRQVRWFGCLGMAISSLTFYYLPVYAGHNFAVALIPAIMLGIFVAAFVPMTAVFPTLEPHHKGAAVSIYNLSAGMSNFVAPAIASALLPFFDIVGVVWAYRALYLRRCADLYHQSAAAQTRAPGTFSGRGGTERVNRHKAQCPCALSRFFQAVSPVIIIHAVNRIALFQHLRTRKPSFSSSRTDP
jgi:MFS family permease